MKDRQRQRRDKDKQTATESVSVCSSPRHAEALPRHPIVSQGGEGGKGSTIQGKGDTPTCPTCLSLQVLAKLKDMGWSFLYKKKSFVTVIATFFIDFGLDVNGKIN